MKTIILADREIDPEQWDAFIQRSPQAAIYAHYSYISTIKNKWQAVIVEEKGEWCAVMPISMTKKWKYRAILQPFFAQYWGIYCIPLPAKATYEKYHKQKKWISAIVEAIDDVDLFAINFSPRFEYSLPFYWKNYNLQTRYTYQLDLVRSEEELFEQFAPPLKRQIRKAKRNGLKLVDIPSTSAFMQLIDVNEKAGRSLLGQASDSKHIFVALCTHLQANGKGNIWGIMDGADRLLAAGLYIRDGHRMIYLLGAYLPAARDSGAMSLLMWEAIRQAKTAEMTLFDFEGSMIEGIETFFRKFGAHSVSYLHIRRNQLPIFIKWIRELL